LPRYPEKKKSTNLVYFTICDPYIIKHVNIYSLVQNVSKIYPDNHRILLLLYKIKTTKIENRIQLNLNVYIKKVYLNV